jgi:membrane associated rhomboid family serine protease
LVKEVLDAASAGCEDRVMLIADRNHLTRIKRPWVTLGLIALCSLLFLAEVGASDLPAWLVFRAGDLWEKSGSVVTWIGLLGHALTHADFMHLFGNMLVLWIFGDNVEDALGHLRFLLLLIFAAMAGAVAMALTAPADTLLVGASGGISGVMAAYLLLYPHARVLMLAWKGVPMQVPAGWFVALWFTVNLLRALLDAVGPAAERDNVAWIAHVVGFLAGLVFTIGARPQGVALFQRERIAAGSAGSWLWTRTWNLGPDENGKIDHRTLAKAGLFVLLAGAGMLLTG